MRLAWTFACCHQRISGPCTQHSNPATRYLRYLAYAHEGVYADGEYHCCPQIDQWWTWPWLRSWDNDIFLLWWVSFAWDLLSGDVATGANSSSRAILSRLISREVLGEPYVAVTGREMDNPLFPHFPIIGLLSSTEMAIGSWRVSIWLDWSLAMSY